MFMRCCLVALNYSAWCTANRYMGLDGETNSKSVFIKNTVLGWKLQFSKSRVSLWAHSISIVKLVRRSCGIVLWVAFGIDVYAMLCLSVLNYPGWCTDQRSMAFRKYTSAGNLNINHSVYYISGKRTINIVYTKKLMHVKFPYICHGRVICLNVRYKSSFVLMSLK